MCEQFELGDVNRGVEHVRSGKAGYGVVLAS